MPHLGLLLLMIVVLVDGGRSFAPNLALRVPDLAAWGLMIGWVCMVCAVAARRTGSLVARVDRHGDRRAVARARAASRRAELLVTIGSASLAAVFGMLGRTREALGDAVLIDEAVVLLPAALGLVAVWWIDAETERRVALAGWQSRLVQGAPVGGVATREAIVVDRVRTTLVPTLLPVAMVVGIGEMVSIGALGLGPSARAWLQLAGLVAVAGVLPSVLVRVMGVVPLDGGSVRERVGEMSEAAGVRPPRAVLWPAGGAVNAAVLGLLPRFRYLLMTDGLLERLDAPQVDAVIGHELGHIRCGHLAWLVGVCAVTLTGCSTLAGLAWAILAGGEQTSTTTGASIGVGAAATVLVFGWVSRRFERQADAFAAALLARLRGSERIGREDTDAMASALRSVSRVNGVRLHAWTFRHGSLAWRIRHVRALSGERMSSLSIDRVARRIQRATVVGGAVVAGVVLAASFPP